MLYEKNDPEEDCYPCDYSIPVCFRCRGRRHGSVHLVQPGCAQGEIVAFLNKTLNREVSYENQDFSFWFGPTFTFRGIEIKERNGKDTFAAIERLSFKVAVLPLLTGKIVIKKMHFEKPSCSLYRDSNGVLNIGDLLKVKKPLPLRSEEWSSLTER